MHPIFQSFKRTYWASMRFSRGAMWDFTDAYRITPARFDMMLVIATQPSGMPMTEVRAVLDVCPSVVTVMVKSLVKLGYVEKWLIPGSGNAKEVALTELGAELLAKVSQRMLYDGLAEYFVRAVLARTPRNGPHTERVLARTRRIVAHFRSRVRDRSTLVYPAYLPDGERSPAHPYTRTRHAYEPAAPS
jgi:DNA-binding MarR family transcriptional regulator